MLNTTHTTQEGPDATAPLVTTTGIVVTRPAVIGLADILAFVRGTDPEARERLRSAIDVADAPALPDGYESELRAAKAMRAVIDRAHGSGAGRQQEYDYLCTARFGDCEMHAHAHCSSCNRPLFHEQDSIHACESCDDCLICDDCRVAFHALCPHCEVTT